MVMCRPLVKERQISTECSGRPLKEIPGKVFRCTHICDFQVGISDDSILCWAFVSIGALKRALLIRLMEKEIE